MAVAISIAKRNRIAAAEERDARRTFPFRADHRGTCDTCHRGGFDDLLDLVTLDAEDGWSECVDCDAKRAGRQAVRASERRLEMAR